MAIEKMALVHIEGNLRRVNKALVKCCESNCFHIIPAKSGAGDNEGRFKALKSKSPFDSVEKRARALADGLGIEIRRVDYDDVDMNVSVDFDRYYKGIEQEFNELSEKKAAIEENLKDHSTALMQVEKLSGLDIDFSEIFACKYVKLRFGRLPVDSMPKLEYYKDRNFIYYHFKEEDGYAQILYLTTVADYLEIDDLFDSLFFERVHLPDYFKGDADEAKTQMIKLVKEENLKLEEVRNEIAALKNRVEEEFLKVTGKLIALDRSYFLRSNVLAVNGKFSMSGYVPRRKLKEFTASVESVQDVTVEGKPLDSEPNASPPVLLRNCWLFRPFEMFVKMYGLPNYKCFDPTPYVGITFMLIFGIMFGDLGQGLVITALGIILDKWRKVKLAPVMQRIGITSALFGILYGSVFGSEEIIEPFFKIPSVYKALGYAEAPADIFQVSSILLIAAIGIGAILVLISMAMNVVTNIRSSKWLSDAVLSPNGIVGMVFYGSLIAGAALQIGLGIETFTAPYVICLIVLPLVLLFFKEPIISFFSKSSHHGGKSKGADILRAVKTYSDAVSTLLNVNESEELLDRLSRSKNVKAQYGTMSIDAYNKIKASSNKSFVYYPFENDEQSVTGVYIFSEESGSDTEKVFQNAGFKKIKMPEHIEDIRKEEGLNLSRYINEVKKEHKSVGNFIIENFIELFESCLSYITNTMSFLRIGGFILSHAGLMLVVSILAGNDGGAGSIVVQVIGNLVVIGIEGFLVGIQVLRLEFYEIFSRFYKGDGKPFNPVSANFALEE